jgi:hypothetical protein
MLISTPMEYQPNAEVFGRSSMKVSPKLQPPGIVEHKSVDLVKDVLVRSSGVAGDVDMTKDNG